MPTRSNKVNSKWKPMPSKDSPSLILLAVCMFDNFRLMLNFKSKVLRDVVKNKNECQLTSTFYFKMSPQFWVTRYFRKNDILSNQNTILICNQKKLSNECKYPSVSHVSFTCWRWWYDLLHPLQVHKERPAKDHQGLQVQPIAQVAFHCILFGKSSLKSKLYLMEWV